MDKTKLMYLSAGSRTKKAATTSRAGHTSKLKTIT
ncbi:hypothetical protein J2Z45_002637 [Cohnella lubricantis]|nr:hypothetical protein [Cohnella lubricantis]